MYINRIIEYENSVIPTAANLHSSCILLMIYTSQNENQGAWEEQNFLEMKVYGIDLECALNL